MGEIEIIDHSHKLTDFRDFLALQESLWRESIECADAPVRVLFFEHPPTISLGMVPWELQLPFLRVSGEWLRERNVPLVKTMRGGALAVHGPGILGCYVVARVSGLDRSSAFVRRLLLWAKRALMGIGVPVWELDDKLRTDRARKEKYTGLWIGNRKVVSVGVEAPRGTSRFGININISPESWLLSLIHPCGITEYQLSSLHEEGYRIGQKEVVARLKESIQALCENK